MAQPAPEQARHPRRRRKWLRRAGWALGLAIALAAGLWIAAPFAIAKAVESWLAAQGSSAASVGRVIIGFPSIRIELHDLRSTSPAGEQFVIERAVASLDLAPLLDRRILLRELLFEGIEVSVERSAPGRWRIGGLSLGGAPRSSANDGWAFGVRDVDLRQARVALRAFGIDDTFTIDRLRLTNVVSWDETGPLTIEADLGKGSATLGARGAARLFSADRDARVEIEANAVPLDALAPLARLAGVTGLNGLARLRVTLTGSDRGRGVHLALAGSIGVDDGHIHAGTLSAGLDGLAWEGRAEADFGGGTALDAKIDGALTLARLDARKGEAVVTANSLRWKSSWRISRPAGASAIEVAGGGELTAKDIGYRGGDTDGRASGASWKGSTSLSIGPGRTLYGMLDGELSLGAPRGEIAQGQVAASAAIWRGAINASRAGTQNEIGVMMRGAIGAEMLEVQAKAAGLFGRARALDWEGQIEIERSDSSPEVFGSVDGRTTLRQAAVDDPARGVQLISVQRATTSGLFIGFGGEVFARDVDAERLRLLTRVQGKDPVPLLAARSLFLDHVGVSAEGIRVQDIRLDGAAMTLVHEGEGRIAGIDLFRKAPRVEKGDSASAGGGASGVSSGIAAIGPIQIGESRLVLVDRSLSPAFTAEIGPLSATMGLLSPTEPASDTPVMLDATLQPHTNLALKGTIRPLAARPTLALSGSIRSLDLATVSRYAEPWLGYAVKTGQMNGQADIRIDDGRIAGSGRVDVYRLSLEPLESGGEALAEALPVSLETALDLLRDDRNRIRVEVPVSGDIRDPQFDLSDVINRAVGRAISDTLTTTLKLLFPIGALAAAVIEESSADGELRFSPLGFQPGSTALDTAATSYLDQLAELLKRRPRIRVSLCGAATGQDRAALIQMLPNTTGTGPGGSAREGGGRDEERISSSAIRSTAAEITDARLIELAGARAEVARGYLVTQRGIESRRLSNCRPSLDNAEDALPRLDVVL